MANSVVFSRDELARWQLVLFQRPVASLHSFPFFIRQVWHRDGVPLGVEAGLEEIHL